MESLKLGWHIGSTAFSYVEKIDEKNRIPNLTRTVGISKRFFRIVFPHRPSRSVFRRFVATLHCQTWLESSRTDTGTLLKRTLCKVATVVDPLKCHRYVYFSSLPLSHISFPPRSLSLRVFIYRTIALPYSNRVVGGVRSMILFRPHSSTDECRDGRIRPSFLPSHVLLPTSVRHRCAFAGASSWLLLYQIVSQQKTNSVLV